jgi:hypothetical protein
LYVFIIAIQENQPKVDTSAHLNQQEKENGCKRARLNPNETQTLRRSERVEAARKRNNEVHNNKSIECQIYSSSLSASSPVDCINQIQKCLQRNVETRR